MSEPMEGWRACWSQRFPPFVARIETTPDFGSGLQIDAEHVLTCAHVLRPKEEPSRGPVSTATVHFGGSVTPARLVQQDTDLDLALLRLDEPRHGVLAPLVWKHGFQGEAYVLGFISVQRGFASNLHTIANLHMQGSDIAGRLTHVKHLFGIAGGASGAGVFAAHAGAPIFLGLARLGGDTAGIGGIIAAPAVLHFLHSSLGPQRPAETAATPYHRHLQAMGLAPRYELRTAHNAITLLFVALASADPKGAASPIFVLSGVVAERDARRSTGRPVWPAHDRLPARAVHPGDVEDVVLGLSEAVGCPLRLPTPAEIEMAWDLANAGSGPARRPEGRPVVLKDFALNGLGIAVPPLGLPEWAREPDGTMHAIEARLRDGALRLAALPAARVGSQTPVFRVVFDVRGT